MMRVSDVKVGDRLELSNRGEWATVTELIRDGFKYVLDEPICIHPFLGTYDRGEHYGCGGEVCDAAWYERANARVQPSRAEYDMCCAIFQLGWAKRATEKE